MRSDSFHYFTVPAKSWQLCSPPNVFEAFPYHHVEVAKDTCSARHLVHRRVRLLQLFTINWMAFEAVASLASAWRADSPSLAAFGGDSLIELVSAAVVFWRFASRGAAERVEQKAARIAGILLILLAAYVAAVSAVSLLGYQEPRPSVFGIFVLLAAAVVMPWLAREKRKLSAATESAALRADASESSLCGYLALIALAGLLGNWFWNIGRADTLAAIALIPFMLSEAREALRGRACACLP